MWCLPESCLEVRPPLVRWLWPVLLYPLCPSRLLSPCVRLRWEKLLGCQSEILAFETSTLLRWDSLPGTVVRCIGTPLPLDILSGPWEVRAWMVLIRFLFVSSRSTPVLLTTSSGLLAQVRFGVSLPRLLALTLHLDPFLLLLLLSVLDHCVFRLGSVTHCPAADMRSLRLFGGLSLLSILRNFSINGSWLFFCHLFSLPFNPCCCCCDYLCFPYASFVLYCFWLLSMCRSWGRVGHWSCALWVIPFFFGSFAEWLSSSPSPPTSQIWLCSLVCGTQWSRVWLGALPQGPEWRRR